MVLFLSFSLCICISRIQTKYILLDHEFIYHLLFLIAFIISFALHFDKSFIIQFYSQNVRMDNIETLGIYFMCLLR